MARASLKEVVNAVLALACAAGLSGCGTVVNLATFKPEVYGGVAKDVHFFDRLMFPNGNPPSASGEKGRIGLLAFCVAEMSCSAVGDTLTLPLVLLWRAATIPPGRRSLARRRRGGSPGPVFRRLRRHSRCGKPGPSAAERNGGRPLTFGAA
jgi:uncharacterized protein YceK